MNSLSKSGVYFVTRAKKNINYEIIGQQEVNEKKGLLFDYTIKLKGYYQSRYYPEKLRLVGFYDAETDKELVFLTNNFLLSAYTITQIYKARWKIEEFYRWIKQNLRIKSFLGTSENAVLTQIWVAMCYYLLLSYINIRFSNYPFPITMPSAREEPQSLSKLERSNQIKGNLFYQIGERKNKVERNC
ncbi:MAG TPA: IS4 family transposase [Thermodesulfobacteriota bacterium]|nr:IS4 family transposase [Thermodesulfobacteriota bacterium]